MTEGAAKLAVAMACAAFGAGPACAETADQAKWRAALQACAAYARTGALPDAAGWLRGMTLGADGVFQDRATGAVVETLPAEVARAGRKPLCQTARVPGIPGNDEVGLALRAIAHDVLDGQFDFRPEDQTGPADAWRGCAFDGREFRLNSMTQTTYAGFWIAVSPRDPGCRYLGS